MLRLILLLNFVQTVLASFCGEGFMAFSLSVSFGGQFTLGCAQPSCLKFPVIENPTFAFVNGVKDGFVNLPLIGEKTFIEDRAVCQSKFEATSCTGDDEWLGGIAPISDLKNATSLSLRCCKHWAMKVAKFQKVVTLRNGETFFGGDIYDDEEEEVIAFDYITNVEKFDTDNGTMIEIVVNRLPCNAETKSSIESTKNNVKLRVHQAPLVETGDYPAVDYDSVTAGAEEETTSASEVAPEEGSYSEQKEELHLTPPEPATPDSAPAPVDAQPGISPPPSQLEQPQAPAQPQYSPNPEPIQNQQPQSQPSYAQEQPQQQQQQQQPQQQQQQQSPPPYGQEQQQQQQQQSQSPPSYGHEQQQQQPQPQTQQVQTSLQTNSGYAQPGGMNQQQQPQQSSYANPFMSHLQQPQQTPYQAPFYPMQPMLSPFMNPMQSQCCDPGSSGVAAQSYQSQSSSGYYPVAQSSGGGGGCCGGMMCFTGDTLVTLMNGTKKRMDELTTHDWVLSAGGNKVGYSKINTWLHRKPKIVTEFIKFTLENGSELKMTKKHFIFKGDCNDLSSPVKVAAATQNMVYAENVTIDDCLFVINKNKKLVKSRISKIETVKEKGIYSPMTNNGNIIVNDVFASCFNIVENDVVQITFPSIIRKTKNFFSKLLFGYFIGAVDSSYQSYQSEVELIPGLRGLVEIVKFIVPNK